MKTLCSILFILTFISCNHLSRNAININDFGAKGDSSTLNTTAINNAINEAYEKGGGEVVVPPGIYLSGTIFMKDNVTLNILAGATILGSPDIGDYYEHTWGHNNDRQPYHLVLGLNANNIEICGGGTIDGNGQAFWKDWHPDSLPKWIMAKELKVSPMMEIEGCKDVRIKDVTLLTGGGWTLHLYNSDQVQVNRVKILNNLYSPNGDGIDISGSKDVTISDCIIKTCDDAICLKTMVDSKECKRVVVNNCVIECLCAALKIGNESFRDISQVSFTNCVIYGSSRAFAIYAESAGTVRDIIVNNIITDTKVPLLYNRPIHLSLYLPGPGAGGRTGDWMHQEKKQWDYEGREPSMENITITNFTARTEGRILVTAEEGRYIKNLVMQNITLSYPWVENPVPYVDEVTSSQFAPVKQSAKTATAAVVLENVENLALDNLVVDWPQTDSVPEEWQFKKKIANGTLKSFYPTYGKAVEVPFHAIYARGLKGGYIHAPLAKASDTWMDAFDIKKSNVILK